MEEQAPEVLMLVFKVLDMVDLGRISLVCRRWQSIVDLCWAGKELDLQQLFEVAGYDVRETLRRFSLALGCLRPGGLRMSRNVRVAQVLSFVRNSERFCSRMKTLDLQGVALCNADLLLVPTSLWSRLRRVNVAPEEELISVLSLDPLARHCDKLTHLRWQGFLALSPSHLLDLLTKNQSSLQVLQLEAHPQGWKMHDDIARVLTAQSLHLPLLRHLTLSGAIFSSRGPIVTAMERRGATLRHLHLTQTTLFSAPSISASPSSSSASASSDLYGHLFDVIRLQCPLLKTLSLPDDAPSHWDAVEPFFVQLPHLRWIQCYAYGHRPLWRSSLMPNVISGDDVVSSVRSEEEGDSLWQMVQSLRFFDTSSFVAPALYIRLQSSRFYQGTWTLSSVEWMCFQRAKLVRSSAIGQCPVFSI